MMEYRHKIMRSTVGVVINRAIRDIQDDPKRSIRNLADMGENFSKSAAQKKFFEMTGDILKKPDNHYNELLVNMIQNVNADTIRTVSLNFGYTSLNYGACILRENSKDGKKIPWVLHFDCSAGQNVFGLPRMDAIISDAVSLGIYTYIFQIDGAAERLPELMQLCKNHGECSFFAAVSPKIFQRTQQFTETPNLIFSVNVTGGEGEDGTDRALQVLHESKCFYGFHAYYTKENAAWLMSSQFTQRMISGGCLFGAYVNADRKEKELEDQMYRYVCTKRGKKGEAPFVFDFGRDIRYIGDVISCGAYLSVGVNGEVKLDGGRSADLNNITLSELLK
ncbi:MAG: hypothetical protein K0Q85_870 [Caproiciproducens sp.]|nr:hypothetical protein [Caproiciproducens sp.]